MLMRQGQGDGDSDGDYGSGLKSKSALCFGPSGLLTSSLAPGGQADVHEVSFPHFADQPLIRSFVSSSAGIFCAVRNELERSGKATVPMPIIAELSMNYRGAILELIRSLREQQLEEHDVSMLYTHLDTVWHFCEIMFITSHPELPILPYFMEWVRVNFDTSENILVSLMSELPDLDPDNLKLLWGVIFSHTVQGRTAEAAKLLEFVTQENSVVLTNQLKLMSELMRKKPVFSPASSSVSDFEMAFTIWKEECENRLQSQAFTGSPELTLLAKILCGDKEGFKEARQHACTWYEYLAMTLNYQFPLIRPKSLQLFARKAIDEYGDCSIVLTPIEEIILAAMDYDIVLVLKEMQTCWNHPWFALHFSDLICSGGIYSSVADSRIDYKSVSLIRHDLVREYGIDLMQHSALWEIGVKYLEGIPECIGFPIIAELLSRKKITSDYEAEKVIRVATQFGFAKEVHGICREIAARKIGEGYYQHALLWAIRAKDGSLTSGIIDRILIDGDLEIAPQLVQLLPNFSSCGDKLLFLNAFCEFSKRMVKEEFTEAVELLCIMIEQQIIPKRLGPKLLVCLYDIRDHGIILSPPEVSILLQYIHSQMSVNILVEDVYRELNQILLSNRALNILHKFRDLKRDTRSAPIPIPIPIDIDME